LADAVEKVSGKEAVELELYNRIPAHGFLNQDCVFALDLESVSQTPLSKSYFNSIDPTRTSHDCVPIYEYTP
jgi:hypothetical protein